ncbi:MAG: phage terminase large subunit family protein, partial [Candidatus Heimdallarchaeaceae archaeon]
VSAKVDSSGMGDRFADEIRKEFIKGGISTSIMPTKFSAPMKERMFGELRTLFENDQIRIPNDPVLLNQLFQFERTITEGGTVRFKGRHDDCVMALALACFELTRERPIFRIKGV